MRKAFQHVSQLVKSAIRLGALKTPRCMGSGVSNPTDPLEACCDLLGKLTTLYERPRRVSRTSSPATCRRPPAARFTFAAAASSRAPPNVNQNRVTIYSTGPRQPCYRSGVRRRPPKDDSIPIPPLPSQFLSAPKDSTPERRLLAAVLEDAVHIIRHGPEYHEGRPYRDAVAWIMAERNDWPFCFVALCEELGLNADKVRAQLLRQ